MRLIDADKSIEIIISIGYVPVCVDCITKHKITEIIERQPTAYNVDKVVEQLGDEFEQVVAVILDMTGSDYTIADFNLAPFKERLLEVVKAGIR